MSESFLKKLLYDTIEDLENVNFEETRDLESQIGFHKEKIEGLQRKIKILNKEVRFDHIKEISEAMDLIWPEEK